MRLALGLGLPYGSGVAFTPSFHPTQLPGLVALYDISDLSSLFVERTGASASTPASVDGVVGTVLDLSGKGNHVTAPSDAARPILRLNDGIYTAEFDGVDDALFRATATILRNVGGGTIVVAYHPDSDITNGGMLAVSAGNNENNVRLASEINQSQYCVRWRRLDTDNLGRVGSSTDYEVAPTVQTVTLDYANGGSDAAIVRINGEIVATGAVTGSGNTSDTDSRRITVGSTLLFTGLWYKGRIAAVAVFERVLGPTETAKMEYWCGERIGLAL